VSDVIYLDKHVILIRIYTYSCLTTGKRKKEAIAHIKATIITYKILGLDKTAPEDIDELEQMMTHLMFMAL